MKHQMQSLVILASFKCSAVKVALLLLLKISYTCSRRSSLALNFL